MVEETQASDWLTPKFYFKVDFGNEALIFFEEINGLEGEVRPLEDGQENTGFFTTIQKPGLVKSACLILKHGFFSKENKFLDWYNNLKKNKFSRHNVIIQLCEEDGPPIITWTLNNAWPTKISNMNVKSDAKEVVLETMEICYEGLTLSKK